MPTGNVATWKVSLVSKTAESRLATFDYSRFAEMLAGDTILSSPAPLPEFLTPAGANAPTVGSPVINSAGTQVQFRVSFPQSSPTGVLYSSSCAVATAQNNELVCAGTLLLADCLSGGDVAVWKESIFGTTESRVGPFDFSQFPEMLAGDTITGTPLIETLTPAGATALTVVNGSVVVNAAGTQVQARFTLPKSSLVGYLYPVCCIAQTTQGNTLICSGLLDFVGSQ